jgi:hypothetical protein
MKVAQYEVLGWRLEKAIRPGRDDRWPPTREATGLETRGQTFQSSLAGRTSLFG